MRVIIIVVLLAAIHFTVFAADLTGKPRIIDGDTIEIGGERIRLHGIDAPEAKQTCQRADGSEYRCGEVATFALAEIIETHWITCKGEARDRYQRRIAVCYAGPYDINAKMVERGWALAYRKYSLDYVDEERIARAQGVGMWEGEFIVPWDWRRGVRAPEKETLILKNIAEIAHLTMR
jgi:endonuclease YncB( thermonuclease family)